MFTPVLQTWLRLCDPITHCVCLQTLALSLLFAGSQWFVWMSYCKSDCSSTSQFNRTVHFHKDVQQFGCQHFSSVCVCEREKWIISSQTFSPAHSSSSRWIVSECLPMENRQPSAMSVAPSALKCKWLFPGQTDGVVRYTTPLCACSDETKALLVCQGMRPH